MPMTSNYGPFLDECVKLAAVLEVDLPEDLLKQEGVPASRFGSVLGAVTELLAEANAQFGAEEVDTEDFEGE